MLDSTYIDEIRDIAKQISEHPGESQSAVSTLISKVQAYVFELANSLPKEKLQPVILLFFLCVTQERGLVVEAFDGPEIFQQEMNNLMSEYPGLYELIEILAKIPSGKKLLEGSLEQSIAPLVMN